MTHRYDDASRKQRGILPGFPKKGKFQTIEEINAYFSGDKIQCLRCGKWFKAITGNHLLCKHQITIEEYKEMYGLPWVRGLCSEPTREIKVGLGKKMWVDGKLLEKAMEKIRKGKRRPRRPVQPFNKDLSRKQMSALHKVRKKFGRKDFEAILDRMRKEKRSLKDVCNDTDLPSYGTWQEFLKRRPEYAKKAKKIHYNLPLSVQLKTQDVSPEFRIECERLRAKGKEMSEIAEVMGVKYSYIQSTLTSYNKKMGLARTKRAHKWSIEDYEAILKRMRDEGRSLWDVCTDPDFPEIFSWHSFVKKHPEYSRKAEKIHHTLPYSVQIKHYAKSPRFQIDCERLRARGMEMKEIADALGVGYAYVVITLREYNKKRV